MAKIEGEILIGRPVEEVFDFVADSRNEPSFNPAMTASSCSPRCPSGGGHGSGTHGPGRHADAGGADRLSTGRTGSARAQPAR